MSYVKLAAQVTVVVTDRIYEEQNFAGVSAHQM